MCSVLKNFLIMSAVVISLLIVVLISALIGGPLEGAMARIKA